MSDASSRRPSAGSWGGSTLRWEEALDLVGGILASAPARVVVVGEADAGKSAFVRAVREKAVAARSWTLETDPGQPAVGVPATMSLVDPTGSVAASYFLGDFTPARSIALFLDGIALLGHLAPADAPLLVDTCGLVAPPLGPALKAAKARIVGADAIVALFRSEEGLAHVERIELLAGPIVGRFLRVRASEAARPVPAEERRAARTRRLRERFATVIEARLEIPERAVDISAAGSAGVGALREGSLFSLDTDRGEMAALGVCVRIGRRGSALSLTALLDREPGAFRALRVGRVLLEPDGTFVGYLDDRREQL